MNSAAINHNYRELDLANAPSLADLVWFYQNGFMLTRLERLDVQRHLEARK